MSFNPGAEKLLGAESITVVRACIIPQPLGTFFALSQQILMNPEQFQEQTWKARWPPSKGAVAKPSQETADGVKLQDNYKQQPERCKCNTSLKLGQDAACKHDIETLFIISAICRAFFPFLKPAYIFSKQNFSKQKREDFSHAKTSCGLP